MGSSKPKRSPSTTEKGAFILILLLVLPAAGCTPQLLLYRAALESEGEIHLYLQPLPQEAHRLEFSIAGISAVRDDGSAIPLPLALEELKCRELVAVQKRLASTPLPPGLYRGISIEFGTAFLVGEEGRTALLVPEEPLFIEQEFNVIRKRATAVFLSMDPARVVASGFRLAPVFSLARSERKLRNLLGFATSSGGNLVSVFNKHTMEVVDIIATRSGPKGAVLDQRKGWVYISLAGDDAIEAIEVTTGQILGNVKLNFGDEPVEIALSSDGRTLVSANYGTNTASIIDTSSLREVERIGLPSEATSVVMDTGAPRAYVLHAMSNAVSVIDLARRELGATRALEEIPIRGAISRDGARLYVITRDSPDLLVIDTAGLTVIGRIFVGIGAASIKVDGKTGLIYVGRRTGDIAVIDPSSSMSIDLFVVKGEAEYLAIDDDENSLFVVLPDRKEIHKIDLVSKKLLGTIDVEEGSYAVVMMGER